MLANVHGALAGALRTPELVLTEPEAKGLAEAICKVQEQYGSQLDPRAEAWIGLGMVAGSIYVPRALAIRERRMQEAEADATSSVQRLSS